MQLFRPIFFACLVLYGGAALLIGAVATYSALSTGTVMLSYMADGKAVSETVLRASEPDRYWRLVAMAGIMPLVLGAGTVWLGVRKIKG